MSYLRLKIGCKHHLTNVVRREHPVKWRSRAWNVFFFFHSYGPKYQLKITYHAIYCLGIVPSKQPYFLIGISGHSCSVTFFFRRQHVRLEAAIFAPNPHHHHHLFVTIKHHISWLAMFCSIHPTSSNMYNNQVGQFLVFSSHVVLL